MTKDEVLEVINEHKVEFVDLWFSDIEGAVKSVTVPSGKIENVIENGCPFDGSAIEGFARVAESDMVLMPDLSTFSLVPWDMEEGQTARMICTVYTPHGEPFIGDPRTALMRAIESAADMGFEYKTGVELEFFLFKQPDANGGIKTLTPQDNASYFDVTSNGARFVRHKLLNTLVDLNIRIDSTHSETGSGQYEIDFDYNSALISADQVLTSRVALKMVAQAHGLLCTFMPRPSGDLPGSGMHTHQSLHSIETGGNVFVDSDEEYGLSEVARYFLAGQLHHARAMCAVLAPLVNSYKRLGTSLEAPVYVTWAHINRAALIRVPGVKSGDESHTRLELRCPDPSSNPYLAAAVMLKAGLDGIKQRMPLPDALEETLLRQDRSRLRRVEVLPQSLGEALDALENDEVIMSALGAYISDRYLASKRQEVEAYNQQVTPWEVQRYLSRY